MPCLFPCDAPAWSFEIAQHIGSPRCQPGQLASGPRKIIQSPDRLYKAPTDYTKAPKDYTKTRNTIHLIRILDTTLEVLDKDLKYLTRVATNIELASNMKYLISKSQISGKILVLIRKCIK